MTAIFCPICREIVVSYYQHDFQVCSGKHVFADGGTSYVRYGTISGDYPEGKEPDAGMNRVKVTAEDVRKER